VIKAHYPFILGMNFTQIQASHSKKPWSRVIHGIAVFRSARLVFLPWPPKGIPDLQMCRFVLPFNQQGLPFITMKNHQTNHHKTINNHD
jgi:hypothetical protein